MNLLLAIISFCVAAVIGFGLMTLAFYLGRWSEKYFSKKRAINKLKLRYAKGEIPDSQYDQTKKEIDLQ